MEDELRETGRGTSSPIDQENHRTQEIDSKSFNFMLIVFSIAALASIGAVIGAVYLFPALTLSQYRILLLMLCFAAATISALVLKGRAELNLKDWKETTMVIGGPAALWIIASILFSFFLKEETLVRQDPMTIKLLIEILHNKEVDDGWISHPVWQDKIGSLREIISHEETHHFENLISTTHFEGQGYRKVLSADMPVVFLYFDDFMIKLQNLKGKNPGQAHVFSKATSTDSRGKPQAVFLCRDGDSRLRSEEQSGGHWFSINTNPVDCLTVALYENEELVFKYGDILPVAVTKYIQTSDHMNLKLGVITTKALKSNYMLWYTKRFQFMQANELPVLFKAIGSPSGGIQTNGLKELEQELKPWLTLLDKCLKSPCKGMNPKVQEFLKMTAAKATKSIGENVSYASLMHNRQLKDGFYFEAHNLTTPIVATFEWN